MRPSQTFRAAVLVNSPGTSTIDTAFRTAFQSCIADASASQGRQAQVDFFDPIVSQTYPEPGAYDLIVLTGGGGEHDADAKGVAWIERLKGFVRKLEGWGQKCVAVCWGHQVVQVAFGGAVGNMEEGGCEIGVHEIVLTSEGSKFFSARTEQAEPEALSTGGRQDLRIHQFHEREVRTPGTGFVGLAENNQCFVNEANTILTFQGHPEVDEALSRQLLDVSSRFTGANDEEKEALKRRIAGDHDRSKIWHRVVKWACEYAKVERS